MRMRRFILFCHSDFYASMDNRVSSSFEYQRSFYTIQEAMDDFINYGIEEEGGCIAFIVPSGTIRPVLCHDGKSWCWSEVGHGGRVKMKSRFVLFTYRDFYFDGGIISYTNSFSDLQSALDRAEEQKRYCMEISLLSNEKLECILFRGQGYDFRCSTHYDTGWVWA